MVNFQEKYKARTDESLKRIKSAYEHLPDNKLPVMIIDIPYGLTSIPAGEAPGDYFTNVKSMFDHQVKYIAQHMENINDDFVPVLFPWYGTGVVPSAFGCKIAFNEGMEPAIASKAIFEPEDVKKLTPPDPYRDGLMPKVLECIDYMRNNSDLPVDFTDCQGPLTTALSLCGPETLFLWFYEYPEVVHELMDFCAETLIEWITVQKEHAGQKTNSGAFPHRMALPEGHGGVWMSDDDCTVISAEHYREFVVPYNSRILKAFGGGTLHFCGTAIHQLENFMLTEGLTGINNFCMGDFSAVMKMQDVLEDKIALMVCDHAPLDIDSYYAELFSVLKRKGVILASFIDPNIALHKPPHSGTAGKHIPIERDPGELVRKLKEVFCKYI